MYPSNKSFLWKCEVKYVKIVVIIEVSIVGFPSGNKEICVCKVSRAGDPLLSFLSCYSSEYSCEKGKARTCKVSMWKF